MNIKWYGKTTLFVIILITVVGFISWVVGIVFFWMLLRIIGFPTDLWAMLEALSTALAAAAVFSAGFVAYREFSEISNSRYLEIIDRLFEELNSKENIESRRWVYQNMPVDPEVGISRIDDIGREKIKIVLNSLDRISLLTQPGWVDEKLYMPWMNPMVVKTWKKLGPYVEFESRRRNEPDYYRSAKTLAERCIRWRKEHLPDVDNTWIADAL